MRGGIRGKKEQAGRVSFGQAVKSEEEHNTHEHIIDSG